MNPERIAAHHRSRVAYVYVRQSSLHQVRKHTESGRRQHDLGERAVALGWSKERVVVLDDDLGRSAARSQRRPGFERLVAEVALGRVGLVLALDVSRMSRGNRDWYHLLDVCAVTSTLIADAEGLYDPRTYDDRLLLGLKGTMSEAELHVMKQRLVESTRAKAKRGALRYRLPAGYVWDEAGRMVKTPDDEVRAVLAMIFERFQKLGSVHQVQGSLAEEGIRVPVSGARGTVRWSLPSYAHVHRVLTHPLFAGAYVYGRRRTEEVLDESQRPVKRQRSRGREDWHVLQRDHHEGYISWARYEAIQKQITANRRGRSKPGAPREGASLLQGLVLCGRCGRRMRVAYDGKRRLLRYVCVGARRQSGVPACQSFGAVRLERAVEALLIEALEPLGLEAMIEASANHAESARAERDLWQKKVERARYEVDLARRQYDAVDPANRLVARELERRWEMALKDLEAVRLEAEARMESLDQPLTAKEKAQLRRYGKDIRSLWEAPATRSQDRKRVVRCLIENVVVTLPEEDEKIRARVCWVGGEQTEVEVRRGRTGVHRNVAAAELIELVRSLAGEFSDAQIARILSRKGLRTPKDLAFTARRVLGLRRTHDIPGRPVSASRSADVYRADEAATRLGVSRHTVMRWIASGLLSATQATSGAPWRIRLTPADIERLTTGHAPKGWLGLRRTAHVLGVSQQTVLHRLQRGDLEGVRVKVGGRSAWRIRPPTTTYDDRPTLFEHQDT